MEFGNKIMKLRKQINLSQEEIAEKMNVSRQTISKWELGETAPDINQAKKLSNIFKVSLDELTDNNVNNITLEKISNTEKLAGIIIKLLKAFGIIFLGYIVLMIIFFCLFMFVKKQPRLSNIKSTTLKCKIENNDYVISIGDNNYFNCDNCDKKMKVYLNDLTDWANIDQSIKNVNKFFNENGGSCKKKTN